LKKILQERRRELIHEVQGKMREARTDITNEGQVLDDGEHSEVGFQEDIEFAVIQMKAETLNQIDAALSRLAEDAYGRCFECDDEIAERRLRALPFALRCRDCEEQREIEQQQLSWRKLKHYDLTS
jgi:DnaK suppressor protein